MMRCCRGLGVTALCIGMFVTARLGAADAKKVDLKVGDKAPEFAATDDQGKLWKSSEHVGKKILVVYFFPAALTGG